ncbi:AHH domain-containing protein [Hahella sp. HN01]|uniref:AHH domain-containing protein n=1 Tax=Hahella sp. HN01 TaxID=2847262 RepID=UPI001C1ECB2C|nr:AHH domain-containing protein [Hahella sp. HN01]MBU6953249.1 AHH domain-containing protein [Hahella sp. HN01]
MIQVYSQLEKYRQELQILDDDSKATSKAKLAAMPAEKHHPTETLTYNLRLNGRPQPSSRFTAHHIVPGKGKTELISLVRVDMHYLGIRINDPDNGVWLPMTKADKGHWAMPHAPAHREIHTLKYEGWIYRSATRAPAEKAFRAMLRKVTLLLTNGDYPPEIKDPPDNSWKGSL